MMRKAVLLILPMLASCASVMIGTKPWFEKYGKPNFVEKAAFELSCPKDQIEPVAIGTTYTQVGVRGCHKQTSFVYLTNSGAWSRDSEIRTDTAQAPSDAKPGEM